jgi:glycosyltransferase involved in cell wall biosynthesis
MKVLIAADIFPPQSGGPATYAVHIANALKKAGVECAIVVLAPDADKTAADCPVFAPPAGGGKFRRYAAYIRLLSREAKRADVIYAMGPVNAGFPALLVAVFLHKPLVVKVVGDYAWEQGVQRFGVTADIDAFQSSQPHRMPVRILKHIQSLVVRRAVRVITPCKYLKHLVEGWGAEGKNVNVIYNAVHLPDVVPAPKPAGERRIVSVGRLVPWKGMDGLIDVMAAIRDAAPDARLVIVGDGPDMGRLERRIANTRTGDIVSLSGRKTRAETLSLLASADMVVLNSGYEGLSHTLIEALGLGKIVLASAAGGNPEVIVPGQTGELFVWNNREEIAKKIMQALSSGHPPNNAATVLDKFKPETMIQRTLDVLKTVCGS